MFKTANNCSGSCWLALSDLRFCCSMVYERLDGLNSLRKLLLWWFIPVIGCLQHFVECQFQHDSMLLEVFGFVHPLGPGGLSHHDYESIGVLDSHVGRALV